MSKSKNRSGSETRHLRGQIRALKAQVKHLLQRQHFYETNSEELIEEASEVTAEEKCPICRVGVLRTFDFVFATLRKCQACEFEVKERKKG